MCIMNLIPMDISITAAIVGAISAALMTVIIQLAKWFLRRKSLRKAVKTGLYYEIKNHHIVEFKKDEDGSPNFVLAGFQDRFYDNNIANIVDLLSEELIQILSFYYSGLKLVVDYQDRLSKIDSEAKELSSASPETEVKTQRDSLLRQRNEVKHILRGSLAPAMHAKEKLLSILKDVFKEDPAQKKFIDVLPEHQEWWKRFGGE